MVAEPYQLIKICGQSSRASRVLDSTGPYLMSAGG